MGSSRLKIGLNPLLQVLGLPHIEYLSGDIFEKIDPGRSIQVANLLLQY